MRSRLGAASTGGPGRIVESRLGWTDEQSVVGSSVRTRRPAEAWSSVRGVNVGFSEFDRVRPLGWDAALALAVAVAGFTAASGYHGRLPVVLFVLAALGTLAARRSLSVSGVGARGCGGGGGDRWAHLHARLVAVRGDRRALHGRRALRPPDGDHRRAARRCSCWRCRSCTRSTGARSAGTMSHSSRDASRRWWRRGCWATTCAPGGITSGRWRSVRRNSSVSRTRTRAAPRPRSSRGSPARCTTSSRITSA